MKVPGVAVLARLIAGGMVEQKAKRVYHRTKPASKSKVRAIRFDLDLVEFINLQPNVSLFINDLIRREKEKIERMKAIEVREILKEME